MTAALQLWLLRCKSRTNPNLLIFKSSSILLGVKREEGRVLTYPIPLRKCKWEERDPEQQTDGVQQNIRHLGGGKDFITALIRRANSSKLTGFLRDKDMKTVSYSANLQNQTDRFTKKPSLANGCTTNLRTGKKMEPSLLQKLLSSEIKKDKKHLLQVFRFMVVNNFFENSPEKPLKFPQVIVKESGNECEIVEQKSEVIQGDASNGVATLENDRVSTSYDNGSRNVADISTT